MSTHLARILVEHVPDIEGGSIWGCSCGERSPRVDHGDGGTGFFATLMVPTWAAEDWAQHVAETLERQPTP